MDDRGEFPQGPYPVLRQRPGGDQAGRDCDDPPQAAGHPSRPGPWPAFARRNSRARNAIDQRDLGFPWGQAVFHGRRANRSGRHHVRLCLRGVMSAFRVTPAQRCRTARKSAPLRRAHNGAVLSGPEGARRLQRGRMAPTLPFPRMRGRGGGWQTVMIFGVESFGQAVARPIGGPLRSCRTGPAPTAPSAVEENPPRTITVLACACASVAGFVFLDPPACRVLATVQLAGPAYARWECTDSAARRLCWRA